MEAADKLEMGYEVPELFILDREDIITSFSDALENYVK
jgi:hypothetical protein